MPPAWETWTLLWLSAFQFAVAYWWWKGPRIEGTRRIVTALFALNGIVTLRPVLLPYLPGDAYVKGVTGLADNFTLVLMVMFGAAGLDVSGRFRRARKLGGAGLLVAYALLSPFWFMSKLGAFSMPTWDVLATTGVQLLAGILVAGAIVPRLRQPASRQRDAWLLALAGVGLRFAEFSMAELFPTSLVRGLPESGWFVAQHALRVGMAAAVVGALAALIVPYFRDEEPGLVHDASLALLLGGLVLGAGRRIGRGDFPSLIFSFAFLRPLAFAGSQVRLSEGPWQRSRPVRNLVRGGLLFFASLAAVHLGTFWLAAPPAALGFGAALAVMGIPVIRRFDPAPEAPSKPRGDVPEGDSSEGAHRDWPVEEDRVALPDGWQEELRAREEAYRELPEDVQGRLDDLARWQRIVLALDGAPEADELPPYERTTPGLHFATHCPYSNVGPNISRANERWEGILEELGVPGPDLSPGEEPLIEGSWGRAEGLDSPRVKWYRLTELGEEVAAQLREDLGLGDRDAGEVTALVGEGFGGS